MESEKRPKGFLLYYSDCAGLRHLPNNTLGEIFRAIIDFAVDGKETDFENPFMTVIFESMKFAISESTSKYIETCKKKSEAAKRREVEKKSTTVQNSAEESTTVQNSAEESTTVQNSAEHCTTVQNSAEESTTAGNIIKTNKIQDELNQNKDELNRNKDELNLIQDELFNNSLSGKPDSAPDPRADTVTEIIGYLNLRTGKNYSPKSKANIEHIHARLDEGYSLEDFKQAIDNEAAKWMGTDMEKYLRPSTLFNKEKFDGYVNDTYNEPPKSKKQTIYEHNTQMLDGWTNTDEVFDPDEITPIEALPF